MTLLMCATITLVCILFVILFLALVYGPKIYNKLTCGYCRSSAHLVGKVVIVTGANTGIGFETAKDFAGRGARVILACRNEGQAIAACNKIIEETENKDVHYRHLDLSSLRSVRDFASNILATENRLDILVNNAGVIDDVTKKTEDNLIMVIQTNHLGPFLLTNLLLPLLKKSAPARIVNVSSIIYFRGKIDVNSLNKIDPNLAEYMLYANTKLCNVLMTTELSHRLAGSGVTTNALHPGLVSTDILRTDTLFNKINSIMMAWGGKTPYVGAQTTIHLAVSPELKNVTGKFFSDCKEMKLSKYGRDAELARKLWIKSEELVGIKPNEM